MSRLSLACIFGFLLLITGGSARPWDRDVSGFCFEIQDGMALYGNNDRIIEHLTLDECQNECLLETSFQCLSLDYTKHSQVCFLSSESHLTDPAMFGAHHLSVYAVRVPCDEESESDEEEEGSSSWGSGSGSGGGRSSSSDSQGGEWYN